MKYKKIIDVVRRYKNHLFWLAVTLAIILTAIISYPKTSLTMAAHTGIHKMLDEYGRVLPEYRGSFAYKVQKKLEEDGINLKFVTQDSNDAEKSQLEFLVSSPKIDFTTYGNFGGKLPDSVVQEFNSIGITRVEPMYFFVKNNTNIRLVKDLQGKKIAFWTSPEGSKHPAFTKGGDKASPYSDDLFLEQIFQLAGVTPENSILMNTWPKPLSFEQDWDIAIAPILPPKKQVDTMSSDMHQALLDHKISFLQFDDLEALSRNLPQYKIVEIPKSLFIPQKNIPPQDFKTLGVTSSVFIHKNLDSSLVLILADAIKNLYDKPTVLSKKGEFPNFSSVESFPSNKVAEKFYREGDSSILKKYFSPTLAAFIEKLVFILAPLFLVIYPLMTFLPKALSNYCQSKVTNYYKEINVIEEALKSDITDHQMIQVRLDQLDRELRDLKLPLIHDQFVQEIFIVREHIEMIKRKLRSE